MEVLAKREVLAEALAVAQGIAATRSTRPVLQNLLISADKDAVTVCATDMEIGLKLRLSAEDCEVKKEGAVVVSAARMAQIARTVEADQILLVRQENACVVSAGRSKFEVVTEKVEDFPEIPEVPAKVALEMEAEKLAGMTRRTIFAAAREATRYSLNGVHMEVKEGQLELVATDGRRMALVKEKVGKEGKLAAVIVPQKVLGYVDKLKGGGKEEKIGISTGERQIFFSGARGSLVSRLVEGHFPPYGDVVPRDCTKKATIGRAAFLSVMRQAALMTSEESRSVVMSFSQGELMVASRAPDEGSSEIKAEIQYDGEPIDIRFNPQFLIDALSVSEAQDVTLEMKEPASPALLKDGTGFLYVVMPIHIV